MCTFLKTISLVLLSFQIQFLSAQEVEGINHVISRHTVRVTMDRLEDILKEKGMTVFSRIDFTEDARAAGLEMQNAELLIFGNPKVGTPMMVERPTVAIDLPLKALSWEDAGGTVYLAWNDPAYLAQRHSISDSLIARIEGVRNLLTRAAD